MPNKYVGNCTMLVNLEFTLIASSEQEANDLMRAHVAEIELRQWEAAHAKPGIQAIREILVRPAYTVGLLEGE